MGAGLGAGTRFGASPFRGLSPTPYLHLAKLLHRLLLALPGRRGLRLQLLQLGLQLLAGGHGQSTLLAFLIALHLCVPQLGEARSGGAGSGDRRPRLPLHASSIEVYPPAPAQVSSPTPPAPCLSATNPTILSNPTALAQALSLPLAPASSLLPSLLSSPFLKALERSFYNHS